MVCFAIDPVQPDRPAAAGRLCGKFVAFAALVQAMEAPGYRGVMLTLLVVGGLNTAISLFYYLRVVKMMTIDPEPGIGLPVGFSLVSLPVRSWWLSRCRC